jgi:hypothetical protein
MPFTMKPEDSLIQRTQEPLKKGQVIGGHLIVRIEGNRSLEVASGEARITVAVKDYLETPYSFEFVGTGRNTEMAYNTSQRFPSKDPRKK